MLRLGGMNKRDASRKPAQHGAAPTHKVDPDSEVIPHDRPGKNAAGAQTTGQEERRPHGRPGENDETSPPDEIHRKRSRRW
jgi:hypothetical protein